MTMQMHNEHNIQNQIRIWCGEHNILCFRCNVGRVKTIYGTYFDTGLPEGFPDLIILPGNSRLIFCEVKTLKGKQRDAQKVFQKEVEKRGYKYIIARSINDIIKEIGGDYNGQ